VALTFVPKAACDPEIVPKGPKDMYLFADFSVSNEGVLQRKLTNNGEVKWEDNSDALFGTIFGIAKCKAKSFVLFFL
jgi:hypothetical protein